MNPHRALIFVFRISLLLGWFLSLFSSARAQTIYVTDPDVDTFGQVGTVGAYTTSGGALTASNASLLSGLTELTGVAVSGNDLFVANNGDRIGEYTTSGQTVNVSLITGLDDPLCIAISGNDLFFSTGYNNTIAEYTTSGQLVNASLISGLNFPTGIAISGNDIFVANNHDESIGEYTTSGQLVNASLITGLDSPGQIAISGNDIFVANNDNGTVGEYTTSGQTVNASLISGLAEPYGIAASGNDLFVGITDVGTVGEYTTSGQAVNSSLISGFFLPLFIAVGPTILSDLYVGSNSSDSTTDFTSGTNTYGNAFVGFGSTASNNLLSVVNPGTAILIATNLYVGEAGAGNSMIVSSGSQVDVLSNSYIGYSNSSSNNSVLVNGSGSTWSNSDNLFVGYRGSSNNLMIANGGKVLLFTGTGSIRINIGNLTVGEFSSENSLTISSGGQVENTDGFIGYTNTSSNNSVLVSGAGSKWENGEFLTIGFSGSSNNMVISNGGFVEAGQGISIANDAASSNNSVLVTGTNSTLRNGGDLYIGASGEGNSLVVSTGGTVSNANGWIGYYTNSSNNSVLVTGSNSLWTNSGSVAIGEAGAGNSMVISSGGRVGVLGSSLMGYSTASSNNSVLVTGAGSSWSSGFDLLIGSNGSGNSMMISNGGQVLNGYSSYGAVIGLNTDSSNNLVVVTGTNANGTPSTWNNNGSILVGYSGSSNTLVISNGGVVDNGGKYYGATIGYNSTSSNNAVLVTGTNSYFGYDSLISVGYSGSGNNLTISNGAIVSVLDGYGDGMDIGGASNSSNNSVLVSGHASTFSGTDIDVGYGGSSNTLTISNGGQIRSTVNVFNVIGYEDTSSNNVVLVTGSGSLWNISGDLHVGLDGSNNTLMISNGGEVVDSNGYVDSGSVASIGDGSTWSNSTDLYIGYATSGNTLSISNGGVVFSANGVIGNYYTTSNNVVLVTGSGSLWNITGDLHVGLDGSNNTLMISNGGEVVDSNGYVEGGSVASIGAGSTWSNSGNLVIGSYGSGNSLVTSNGGAVFSANGVIGNNPNYTNNLVLVTGMSATGTSSTWNCDGGLFVGKSGNGNTLVISNGGNVSDGYGAIGAESSSNLVLVTGIGSLWTNSAMLLLGAGTSNSGANSLVISNGGAVYAGGLEVGEVGGGATGNSITISSNSTLTVSGSSAIGYQSSSNSLLVSGSNAIWNNGFSGISVGNGDGGSNSSFGNSLVISGGASVSNAGEFILGENVGDNNNTVLVSGTNSLLANSGLLIVGNLGSGTLTIATGGSVAALNGVTIAAGIGSTGSLNYGAFGGSDTHITLSTPTITLGSGSGTLNFNQADSATMASVLSGNATVKQNGSGTTSLTGNNSYTGTTIVNAGTLQSASTTALGVSAVILNDGSLQLTSPLFISALNWTSTNATIDLVNPSGNNYLTVTGGLTLSGGIHDFILSDYTLGDTPTELLAFNATNSISASDFGIIGLSGYTLFKSNNILWLAEAGLNVLSSTTSISDTQSYPSVLFQTNASLSITPTGNLTIRNGVTLNNNAGMNINGILNTPFLFVTPGSFLTGTGTLNGNLTNSGLLTPGNSKNAAGTLTLNGNFSQGAGGIFFLRPSSGTQYNELSVHGITTLGGTLIVSGMDGYLMNLGDKYTFLNSTGALSGTFSSIDAPAGLRGRLIIAGDPTVSLLIAPSSYTELALSQNQNNVARALNSFIPATSGDALVVSTALDSLHSSQYQSTFNTIMPTLYQSMSTIAFNLANAQNSELLQRLWGVRIAGEGFSMSGFADNTIMMEAQNDAKGVLDAKKDILRPGMDSHWGMFVDGNGIFAVANSANMLPNYNSESGGVTTGLTYKWNDNFGTGLYCGYEGSYAKYANNGNIAGGASSLIDNSVRFGLFGTYGEKNAAGEPLGFYADALAGGGYNNYLITRSVSFGTPGASSAINRSANSSPGAGELDSMLAGGYDIKKGNFTFGPSTSLQYTYFGAQGVTESGAQSLDFSSGGWNTSSMLYSLGGHVAYRWQANKDIVLVPQVSLSWQHEFMQNPYSITGTLGGTSPAFSNTSSAPFRDTLYTGVGFTVEFYKRWNASFFYNSSAGNCDLVSQNIFLSAGVSF